MLNAVYKHWLGNSCISPSIWNTNKIYFQNTIISMGSKMYKQGIPPPIVLPRVVNIRIAHTAVKHLSRAGKQGRKASSKCSS